MQQWEYCEVRLIVTAEYEGARPSVIFYRDPSKPWIPPEGASAEQLAMKLGMDGWELVSVIAHQGLEGISSGPRIHWYFKRPFTETNA